MRAWPLLAPLILAGFLRRRCHAAALRPLVVNPPLFVYTESRSNQGKHIMKTASQQPATDEETRRAIIEGFASGEKEGWTPAAEVMKKARAILKKHERKLKKAA